jgi:hypothetical protein
VRFPRAGLSAPLPGGSGYETPGRHDGRPAGYIARCTGTAGRPLKRVPSQEARELELSGGVRSQPQVPEWNAGRRARPKRKGGANRLLRGAPCAPRLPAFRFPFICRKRAEKSL